MSNIVVYNIIMILTLNHLSFTFSIFTSGFSIIPDGIVLTPATVLYWATSQDIIAPSVTIRYAELLVSSHLASVR